MCGITGIYNYKNNRNVSVKEMKKMNRAIQHRGPDGEGVWTNGKIGLGFRRLKIVGTSENSVQPMTNRKRTLYLVCNGEIYNYLQLKRQLEEKGYIFQSDSDSEVVLHLYQEYGVRFIENLSGMFALAIWDSSSQDLIIARDRLGIKPLYYYLYDGGVIFASEIKAILAHPLYKKMINFESLHYYLFYNQIPGPQTFFKNIYSIEPAELLIFKNRYGLKKRKYWSLIFNPIIKDEEEAAEKLITALESSVKSHMESVATPAVGLSGGIDSSILVALLSKYSSKSVRTLSFSFKNDVLLKKKEFQMVDNIVRLFNTDHRNYTLEPQSVIDNLETIIHALDMPICTFSMIYYLCKQVSTTSKVLFTGDGSEELFGKYWNHRLAYSMANILSFLDDKKEKRYYERKFIDKYSRITSEHSFQFSRLYSFREKERRRLYSKFLYKKIRKYNITGHIKRLFREADAGNFFNKVLSIDTRNFLVNHALTVIDRCSMINSVETRHPFLDHKIVELVATFSPYLKFKNGISKYILKKSVKDIIPGSLMNSFSSGVTGPPISKWLLFELEEYTRNILSPDNLKRHGFFNTNYVQSLLNEYYLFRNVHKKHENYSFSLPSKNHTIKIWKLLIFQLWWERIFS